MAFGPAFQSNMPCNGGTAAMSPDSVFLNISGTFVLGNVPILAHLCSLGSGTTITGLLSETGTPAIGDDATLTNADQWNQSGKGYQAALVKGASFRRATCTSSKMVPPQTGFTCAVYVKIGAALVNDAGFFGKVHSSLAQTRGFGCALDATGSNIEAWVGDRSVAANVASVSSAILVPNEYALVWMRYDETNAGAHTGDLKIRVITSAGSDELEQSGVSGATLGLSAASYSSYFMGGLPEGATGNLTMNGQIVWSMFWDGTASDDLMAAIEADEFMGFTFKTDSIETIELPQTINGYTKVRMQYYLPSTYSNATHPTIFEVPATPVATWTQQEWLDSTLGDTSTGTDPAICSYADYSNRTFKQVCDALPAAYLCVSIFANGSSSILKDSSSQNVTDARQKLLGAFAYLDDMPSNPFSTGDSALTVIAGMSSGFSLAFELAMCSNRATRCVLRHGAETDGVDSATVTSELNQYLQTNYANNYAYADPITLTWGSALNTFTGGTTGGGTTSSGLSNTWASNSSAKAMICLMINWSADSPYPANVNGMIPVMRAQGYTKLYHAIYTTGIHAHHGRDRDLVEDFIRSGLAPFAPYLVGAGRGRMLTDDGDGLL